MKHRTPAAVLFILIAMLSTGCASNVSPVEKVIQARQSYTIVLEALNAAHAGGFLATAEKQKIEPFRLAAAAALDDMEKAALDGGTNSPFSPFTAAAKSFAAALLELAKAQAQADVAKRAVATHAAATSHPATLPH